MDFGGVGLGPGAGEVRPCGAAPRLRRDERGCDAGRVLAGVRQKTARRPDERRLRSASS